jgi:hypothetical protein
MDAYAEDEGKEMRRSSAEETEYEKGEQARMLLRRSKLGAGGNPKGGVVDYKYKALRAADSALNFAQQAAEAARLARAAADAADYSAEAAALEEAIELQRAEQSRWEERENLRLGNLVDQESQTEGALVDTAKQEVESAVEAQERRRVTEENEALRAGVRALRRQLGEATTTIETLTNRFFEVTYFKTDTDIFIQTHIYTRTHMRTHTHTHTHTYTHARTHAHTLTHTKSCPFMFRPLTVRKHTRTSAISCGTSTQRLCGSESR